MKTRIVLLSSIVAACLLLSPSAVVAQQSLGRLVDEEGLGWMLGKWKGTSEDGTEMNLTYEWALNRYVIKTHYKDPSTESIGMITWVGSEEKVLFSAADNNGGTGKGEWLSADGKAILRYESMNSWGEKQRMGIVHSRVDADTMKVQIFGLEGDQLSDVPSMTVRFKRQK